MHLMLVNELYITVTVNMHNYSVTYNYIQSTMFLVKVVMVVDMVSDVSKSVQFTSVPSDPQLQDRSLD